MKHKLTVEEDTWWKESYQPEELRLTLKVLTKEVIIRWKTFKDVNEVNEVKTGDHLNMVLWLIQKVTLQCPK
jgi:hypothetical protein